MKPISSDIVTCPSVCWRRKNSSPFFSSTSLPFPIYIKRVLISQLLHNHVHVIAYLFLIKEGAVAGGILYVNCHLASFLIYPSQYFAVFAAQSLVTDGNVIVRQSTHLQCLIHDFNLFADSSSVQGCQASPDLSHYEIVIFIIVDLLLNVPLLLVYKKPD